ncbi:MAG TPA: ribonuclease HII [Anaerolineales bacterium]|nr:ribonuclease HII [Anaerolineales bacterium]
MTGRFDPALIPSAPDLSLEIPLWAAGVVQVAGIDEAGRGALAGPVTAAALILPPEPRLVEWLQGVRDSKELTQQQREVCAARLRQAAVAWAVGWASPAEIDSLGIVRATQRAALRALESLPVAPQHLLLDYLFLEESPLPQTSLIKGDARSLSIAGASILAKTARDARLREMDACHPGYGFAAHKGYCTPGHLEALARLGPSAIHRMSFAPVRLLEAISDIQED